MQCVMKQLDKFHFIELLQTTTVISTEPQASGEIRSPATEITDFSTPLRSARNDRERTKLLYKPEFDKYKS